MGRICSKKMEAAFPIWPDFYEREGFTELVKEVIRQYIEQQERPR